MHHPRADHGRPGTARQHRAALALSALLLAACGSAHTPTATTRAPASPAKPTSPAVNPAILAVLRQAWTGYTQAFVEPDGRVIDPKRGGLTTSEGQSYALLRAVWMDDRPTFDRAWSWTRANLQVRGDGLFAALWANGAVQDHNSATDADTDIALALLFAARRFGSASYRTEALAVLDGIWDHDVTVVAGMNVVTAGTWAPGQQSPGPVVNPSYLAPYAYRVFAREDPAHPWMSLVQSSYIVLQRCSTAPLDTGSSAGLPPNWCALTRATGAAVAFPQISGSSDFGYDAFRVMWRVAVDDAWNGEPAARDYLTSTPFLVTQWQQTGRLQPVYAHDGRVVSSYDDPTVYGGDIGAFIVADPGAVPALTQHLLASFDATAPAHFGDAQNYYEQNWAWFGLGLAGGALTDLDAG